VGSNDSLVKVVKMDNVVKMDKSINRLIQMLKYKRPSKSIHVNWFIEDFISPVCDRRGGFYDNAGNYIVKIGDNSRVLFSSHTDTVHSVGGTQKVSINGDYIKLHSNEKDRCLGADCTTGVWLMLEMIRANVNGLYIFHADEEIGGVGSNYIVKHHADLLTGIDYAIAFDRKGLTSVITHQSGGRCCSNDFADSLAKLLPFGYVNDAGGTFTDTANYTHIIPECTNISVGYFDQHTNKETQSISHAIALRDAMIAFDESKLVCKRIAGEYDYFDNDFGYYPDYKYHTFSNEYYDLYDYVRSNPDVITDFLNDMGYDLSYFMHQDRNYK
jgi:hypothetical protein